MVRGTAEEQMPLLKDFFDLVFTSPPYFDKEVYSKDGLQCYNKFGSYDKWFSEWLMPVIRLAAAKLRPGGKMVLSLGKGGGHNILEEVRASCDFLRPEPSLFWERPTLCYHRKDQPLKKEEMLVFST